MYVFQTCRKGVPLNNLSVIVLISVSPHLCPVVPSEVRNLFSVTDITPSSGSTPDTGTGGVLALAGLVHALALAVVVQHLRGAAPAPPPLTDRAAACATLKSAL